jgi:outer membrane protein insertion porin family
MKSRHAAALALVALIYWPTSVAFTQTGTIAGVEVIGNRRISEQAIRDHIASQVGQPFDPDKVDADIRSIYRMGDFKSVHSYFEQGQILVITVDEKKDGP